MSLEFLFLYEKVIQHKTVVNLIIFCFYTQGGNRRWRLHVLLWQHIQYNFWKGDFLWTDSGQYGRRWTRSGRLEEVCYGHRSPRHETGRHFGQYLIFNSFEWKNLLKNLSVSFSRSALVWWCGILEIIPFPYIAFTDTRTVDLLLPHRSLTVYSERPRDQQEETA